MKVTKIMSQRKISSSSLQLKAMNQQFGQLVNPLMAARYQAAARYQQANNGLQSSQSQMYGSFSGGGYGHDGGSPGGSCFSIDICPDLILALITAAACALLPQSRRCHTQPRTQPVDMSPSIARCGLSPACPP